MVQLIYIQHLCAVKNGYFILVKLGFVAVDLL